MLAEHSIVVLTRDVPAAGLHAGDVATVVHAYKNGNAYEVDFVDDDGTTIALLTFERNDVRPVAAGEILQARSR